ncbi:MAG TPA: DUF4221 family protein [Chitinophaga sp.]|uniref:DUF4221 family protein n=1 Tax=Chitinophaga sp. TaxID=1869181 RepID=UPI002CFE3EE4|nr:DUF4221 family protein [Chitinophaga sp.]HVI45295.1 DUF4221 family protein [Chitinophaga sp.]
MLQRTCFTALCLWITVAFHACNNGNAATYSNCNIHTDSIVPLRISLNDTLQLYLDSLMVMEIATPIDYYSDEKLLHVYDNHNKRLLTYPVSANGTVYPQPAHMMHVKSKVSWFRYVSPDSLLLYSYAGSRLFRYNTVADSITGKLSFSEKDVSHTPGIMAAHPFACAASPLYFVHHAIIGTGFLLGEKENENIVGRTICASLDPLTGKTSHHIPYSKVYGEYNWGGSHMRNPFATFNTHTGQLAVSLPADHNVQLIDSSWRVHEVYAGSRRNFCITSMPVSKSNRKVRDAMETLQYYMSTPSYRNIIYDPYQDRYYRLLELPQTGSGAPAGKQPCLIAFNKDFKYLGEAFIPPAFALDNFFVTPTGIYFLDVSNKDQNIARYVQCKPEL